MTVWSPSAVLPLESTWSVLNKIAWFNDTTVRAFLDALYSIDGLRPSHRWARDAALAPDAPPRWTTTLALREPGAHEIVVDGQPLSRDLPRRAVAPGGLSQLHGLRTCPQCMTFGYHSVLHQAPGFDRCIVHDVPLITGCALCRRPVDHWAAVDRGVRPYGCDMCRDTVRDDWAPIASRALEGRVRERMALMTPWLDVIGDVHIPDAVAAGFGSDGLPKLELLPLNHARAFGALALAPYPQDMPRPVNPLAGVSFELVAASARGLVAYVDGAELAQSRKTAIVMQQIIDEIDLSISRRLMARHPCVLAFGTRVESFRNMRAIRVQGCPCPFGAALAIWRHWAAEFLDRVQSFGRTLLFLDSETAQQRVARRLEWEWGELAAQLGARSRLFTDAGRDVLHFPARPWWDRDNWCCRYNATVSEPAPRAVLYPIADYEAWALRTPCPVQRR